MVNKLKHTERAPAPSSRRSKERPCTVKVLLIDHNPVFLKSATDFLSRHPGIAVVGSSASDGDGVLLAGALSPDLVLLDIAMTQSNGFQTARSIKCLPNPPKVILVTFYDHPAYRLSAEAAGVDGFVTKQTFGEQLVPQINELFPAFESKPAHQSGNRSSLPVRVVSAAVVNRAFAAPLPVCFAPISRFDVKVRGQARALKQWGQPKFRARYDEMDTSAVRQ